MKKLKTNSTRAKIAEISLWICGVLFILSLFSNILEFFLFKNAQDGIMVGFEEVEKNNLRQIIISFTQGFAFIFSSVTFILWFRRAYYNQEAKFEYMYSSNGWAIGSWFVPILNLFKPYQLMKEIHQNLQEYFVKNHFGELKLYDPKIIDMWWGLCLFLNISQGIVRIILLKSAFPERLMKISIAFIIIDILHILLTYLTIKIIRNYNQMELIILKQRENIDFMSYKNKDLLDSGF